MGRLRVMRPITTIIVHHSATPDGETLSWRAIRHHHTRLRGWRDIGYHVGIERIGPSIETLMGRPWTELGAHTMGCNVASLGICVVGNYDTAPPDAELWAYTVSTISWIAQLLDIRSPANVFGHRELAPDRSCPGDRFSLDALREQLTFAPRAYV